MSILRLLSFFTIFFLLSFSPLIAEEKIVDFKGHWRWGLYADNREDLPPAYRNRPLSEVPEYSLELDIKQKGKRISGHYVSTWQFLSKIEEGEFAAAVKGNTAYLNLESGFGGTVRVRLLRENNLLQWEIIKQKGDNYFHSKVPLVRKTETPNKKDAPDQKTVR